MKINIAIVDDNQALAQALKHELQKFPEIGSVSLASGGASFLKELNVSTDLPHVVLMDIYMAQADEGIRSTRTVLEQYPEIKVVMFTVAEDDDRVFEAFKAGAVGYLLKNEKPAFIVKTIQDVYNGGALMSPGIALKTIRFLAPETTLKTSEDAAMSSLSDREIAVLRLVAKGFTYQSIGTDLAISGQTVKKHMANIFRKLHVKNKIEALNKTKEFL
jgi:DNA-binding NarL/FixJ family response regulator